MLNLPKRNNKPRKTGITSLHDISLTTKQLEFILEEHHEFVDIAKLGIGTAYITPNLNKKIEIYKSFNI
jgi:phosphosulfolactate synthase